MPVYQYKGYRTDGGTAAGIVDAESPKVARLKLRKVGVFPTDMVEQGQAVAGIRYRAWQPPHCLHPTIPPSAPLQLDVVDLWAGRSIACCAYHVAHPGGRSYEQRPVNASEAEARRSARFFALGHSTGVAVPPPGALDPEFPFTLDLR